MDLVAWQEAIQKIGRGTGIRAAHFRGVARRYLSRCLQAVPAWVMPLYKVWESVDPRPGLFDTIIVDEASQCGVDSLLLLYLAKRIIVVGDKMQVSPTLVGVREDDIVALGREHLKDFRYRDLYRPDQSLYHHAERAFGNVVALREHFRCVPEIIRFSNDLCYRDNPLIPLRQYPADRLEPVRHTRVDGLREGNGQRVINRIEAERIVEAIENCLEDERYEDCSFGVIALQGHAQAELIEQLLVERISPEGLEERRLQCGDPTTFQGDERDVVFLSMVAAPNERNQTLTSEVYTQRYNVAMSRAKDQAWLFHSVEPSDLGAKCLRRELINYFRDPTHATEGGLGLDREAIERAAHAGPRQPGLQPSPFESWFEVDVALELLRRRFRVQPQFEVSGYRIDLVVQGQGPQLALECDGDYWHGAERYDDDMARQRQLERAGWRFVRVRESAFYANREHAVESILRACEDLSIFPLPAGGSETTPIDDRSSAAADDEPGMGAEFLPERAHDAPPRAEGPDEAADSEGIPETDGTGEPTPAGGSASPGDGASDDEASEDARDDSSGEQEPTSTLAVGPFTGYDPESGHPDPRQANRADVRRLIHSIVERDGPLSRAALYRLYGEGCPHVQRVGKVIRGELDAAIAALLRSKSLIQDDELGDGSSEGQIIRQPDQRPTIRPTGRRHLQEIPPSEIGLVLERAHPAPGTWTGLSVETLAREVLQHYQMQNLTKPRRVYLTKAFESLRARRARSMGRLVE